MDKFNFFGLNLEELPNCVPYFGFNNVEGFPDRWVEAEMNWVKVGGAGRILKWAGWRWVHDLVTPIAKRKLETTEHEILHDIFLSKKKKSQFQLSWSEFTACKYKVKLIQQYLVIN